MTFEGIRVLLIEDNPGDARLIQEMLAELKESRIDLLHAERLQAGQERLGGGGIDLVLLDLGLPDSQGLDTLVKAYAQAPDVPIIVLTGGDDETLAVRAMQAGAQDYLVKGQVDSHLLVRAMRYAIERQRLLAELEQARQWEQREREFRTLERLAGSAQTAVTAQSFGLASVRQALPDLFKELVKRYGELLELALEQRAYKVEHNLSEGLRALSEQMGFLKAGPRDIVELHSTVLEGKLEAALPQKAQAYTEEGRLLVLELMGYLVSFYRNLAAGAGGVSALKATTREQ